MTILPRALGIVVPTAARRVLLEVPFGQTGYLFRQENRANDIDLPLVQLFALLAEFLKIRPVHDDFIASTDCAAKQRQLLALLRLGHALRKELLLIVPTCFQLFNRIALLFGKVTECQSRVEQNLSRTVIGVDSRIGLTTKPLINYRHLIRRQDLS